MTLEAVLTLGWPDDPDLEYAAVRLHEAAGPEKGGEEYARNLGAFLEGEDRVIYGLDLLFRRRVTGFGPLRKFVAALASLQTSATISCRVDGFAFAFLKGAKNFDFILPEVEKGPFRDGLPDLFRQLQVLEHFERSGTPLSSEIGFTRKTYLGMRDILTRKSARDERASLATLLVSGPSTIDEISKDLGLDYTLPQRFLGVFSQLGVLERRAGKRFAIAMDHLALVVFFLREINGLDLLSILAGGT